MAVVVATDTSTGDNLSPFLLLIFDFANVNIGSFFVTN